MYGVRSLILATFSIKSANLSKRALDSCFTGESSQSGRLQLPSTQTKHSCPSLAEHLFWFLLLSGTMSPSLQVLHLLSSLAAGSGLSLSSASDCALPLTHLVVRQSPLPVLSSGVSSAGSVAEHFNVLQSLGSCLASTLSRKNSESQLHEPERFHLRTHSSLLLQLILLS